MENAFLLEVELFLIKNKQNFFNSIFHPWAHCILSYKYKAAASNPHVDEGNIVQNPHPTTK